MTLALAALPLLVTLGLLARRVRALYAGLIALATALGLAATVFRAPLGQLLGAHLDMVPTAVELAAILLGGLLLSELMSASGQQHRLGSWISQACREPSRAVLLIVLGLTPFMESLTGFGIGMLVAIPLLRQLGITPARAAVVGMLGLVTVPWGSLAAGSLVAARLGGVGFQELGVHSALLSLPVFLIAGAAALLVALGPQPALRALPTLLVAAFSLWGGVWLVNAVIGVPMAGVLGGLGTMAVLLLASRVVERKPSAHQAESIGRSMLVFGFLIGGLLASRAVLTALGIDEGWWVVVFGPGGWLVLTALLTPWLSGADRTVLRRSVPVALRRWWPVTVTTLVFLLVGTLMTATGMSTELARAGSVLGVGYVWLAPWIGGLGGFLTGSNTGANAMLAANQAATAHAISYPADWMVAVQNVSAALGSGAAVARVVLAAQVASSSPGPEDAVPSGSTRAPSADGSAETAGAVTTAETPTSSTVDNNWVLRIVLITHAVVFLTIGAIAALLG